MVEGNAKLNSLQGLGSLTHARSVEIIDNPRLCARGLLPVLRHVDHPLVLSHNRGLSTPDVRQLLGRIEQGLLPTSDTLARLELR